jgi:hypothetical protein
MTNGVLGLARLAIVASLVLVVGSPIGAVLAQSTASEAREVPPDMDESPAALVRPPTRSRTGATAWSSPRVFRDGEC